jgi:hypothetical protein
MEATVTVAVYQLLQRKLDLKKATVTVAVCQLLQRKLDLKDFVHSEHKNQALEIF